MRDWLFSWSSVWWDYLIGEEEVYLLFWESWEPPLVGGRAYSLAKNRWARPFTFRIWGGLVGWKWAAFSSQFPIASQDWERNGKSFFSTKREATLRWLHFHSHIFTPYLHTRFNHGETNLPSSRPVRDAGPPAPTQRFPCFSEKTAEKTILNFRNYSAGKIV